MANTNLSALFGGGSIKRIQYGNIASGTSASPGTATLSNAVDTTKTVIVPAGTESTYNNQASAGNAQYVLGVRFVLTNSTTVTGNVGAGLSTSAYTNAGFWAVEFN